MMKATKHNLKKIETLFKELDYVVRYEKGNFTSGYCMVEARKIAVINKFFDTEARMNTLIEILTTIEIDETVELSEASQKVYKTLSKQVEKEKVDE